MASEVSLDGISTFGLRWKAQVKLPIPKNIPAALAECESYFDRIEFAHKLVISIIKTLERCRKHLPEESLYNLDEIIEQFKDSFVYENIESLVDWELSDLIDIDDYLEDELLEQLNMLYDWADYYRVFFV